MSSRQTEERTGEDPRKGRFSKVTKETAIQVFDSNSIIILSPSEEFLQVVRENMEGVTPRFDRIKIPSGGGPAFEIPTEDGTPDIAKEILGVIVDHHKANAYWPEKFGSGGGNKPPSCSSLDGITGVCTDPGLGLGGPCVRCSKNQWGSAVDKDGKPTRGKACKNLHIVYTVRPGEFFPVKVSIPPTSLANADAFFQRITGKGIPFYAIVTRIGLTKDHNSDGTEYSKATFSRVANLDKDQIGAIREYIYGNEAKKIAGIKAVTRIQAIEAADYNVEEADQEPATKSPDREAF